MLLMHRLYGPVPFLASERFELRAPALVGQVGESGKLPQERW
jgi:hypothetical protein